MCTIAQITGAGVTKLTLSIMMIYKADAFKVIAHSLRMNPSSKSYMLGVISKIRKELEK